jgi:hypothetical protein
MQTTSIADKLEKKFDLIQLPTPALSSKLRSPDQFLLKKVSKSIKSFISFQLRRLEYLSEALAGAYGNGDVTLQALDGQIKVSSFIIQHRTSIRVG